tara:strand:+ start:229 stop:471 length:243 start_codon:yes stop_codon:yes gene_type:complete
MWVQIAISGLILMLILLVWQRWKVSAEWLRMERDLTEEEFENWKSQKMRDAESWTERWKGLEAGFLIILSAVMLGFWFFI